MKKKIVSLLTLFVTSNSLNAASQQVIWSDTNSSLPPFQKNVPNTLSSKQPGYYQLQKMNQRTAKNEHTRYQLLFKGIPIWGHQLIVHTRAHAEPLITGVNVTNIETDVDNINGKLTKDDIEQKILSTFNQPIKFKTITKIISIDEQQKAHLAYHLSFYTTNEHSQISSPNFIIDANSGEILKKWDNAHPSKVGQGMGGNALMLPYRSGTFQYGSAIPGVPSLGRFDVEVSNGNCVVQNESIRVINLDNATLNYNAFPISITDETTRGFQGFSYPCDAKSLYLNFADGGSGPINYAFSPINDTMFFAQKTIEMFTIYYRVKQPLGTDLPLRAFTHLKKMDNAFAIPTIYINGQLVSHQQIVIGNGEEFLTAPSQSVIGHELAHNFTDLNAGLIYREQSGGINEAFSDMAEIALQDYLRQSYPWYWDGKDWTIAREAVISGEPLRYMDDPTKDGRSIGHAKDYTNKLDVHYSSGVFNKAFYLLAHQPGWSVQQAFQVMVDANQHYWQPATDFDFAACGVIQAAVDRELDKNAVIESFSEVGVNCKI